MEVGQNIPRFMTDLFRPAFLISKFLGAMPLHIAEVNGKLMAGFSWLGALQTMGLASFSCAGICILLRCIPECVTTARMLNVSLVTQVGHFLILNGLGTLAICINAFKVRHVPDILKGVFDVNGKLAALGLYENKKPYRLMKLQCAAIFGFFLAFMPWNVMRHSTIDLTMMYMATQWIVVSNFCLMVQYSAISCLLYLQFYTVNQHLASYATSFFPEDPKTVAMEFLGATGHREARMHKCEDLIVLRRCHDRLCGLIRELMSVYQLQMVMISINVFVEILVNVYFSIFGYIEGNSRLHMEDCVMIYTYMTFVIIVFAGTTLISTMTTKEAQGSGVLLYKFADITLTHDVKEEIKLFSLQLLQSEPKFSVCGFFSLDLTLLHSMAAALTTYLVILIQMRESPKIVNREVTDSNFNASTSLAPFLEE